jgi:acyl carrier protein
MRDAVLKSMGPSFVPDQFFTVAQLGLEEWPKTFSGKIQKTRLVSLVKEYRDAQRSIKEQRKVSTSKRSSSLEATVLHIWSSLLSLPPDQIDKDSPPELFADSISILRFRDKLKKETGKTLTLEDMVTHKTIRAQIQFLANQNPQQELARPEIQDARKGPPAADDMIHTHGDPVRAAETQRLVQDVIEPFGLSWQEDVEDVMPAYDFAVVTFKPRRLVAWTFRYALVTTATSPQVSIPPSVSTASTNSPLLKTLRTALQAALSKHSILRSFFIRQSSQPGFESALYVTIRAIEKWFRLCIVEENGSVKTVEELKRYAFGDNVRDHATLPGPLFRAMMVWVEETGSWGLVFNGTYFHFFIGLNCAEGMSVQGLN